MSKCLSNTEDLRTKFQSPRDREETLGHPFSEGETFGHSEKCPLGYEMPLGERAVLHLPERCLSFALFKLTMA